jgi:putative transcriptional regulator
MIKCNLSRIMGERRLKVADVVKDTGINRGTLDRIYNESASRIELEVIEQLCRYLNVTIGELYEVKDE